jgi:type II secretory pathway predicted ATPase ExeA
MTTEMTDHKFDPFGFSSMPFFENEKTPFLDISRKQVIKRIRTFLNHRGFAVLCGASGTGKTMLLNHLCRQLQPNEHRIIYIPFTMLKPADMLKSICLKLDLEPTVSTTKMLGNIQNRITEIQPVNPVLVLDEIQKISHPTLEVIRLMTNFNFEEKNLFSVIMAGSDEFFQKLRLRMNEPLRQRITCFQRLSPLSREDTRQYIKHQFETAGAHHEIITERAASLVYDLVSGIPRLINSLVFASLEEAADAGSKIIDLDHINSGSELVSLPEQEVFQ